MPRVWYTEVKSGRFPVPTKPDDFEVTLNVITRDLSKPLGEQKCEITFTGCKPRAGRKPVIYDPIWGLTIPTEMTVTGNGEAAVRVRLTD